jgi:hypothetical protein
MLFIDNQHDQGSNCSKPAPVDPPRDGESAAATASTNEGLQA